MPAILEKWEVMPHGPLEEADDGILTVAGEIEMPLGHFPRRMTVVALKGGRTAIYSAIALDEPEMARIEKMGQPSILIVPSDAHRMDAKIWKQRYPELRVMAPPGARESVAEGCRSTRRPPTSWTIRRCAGRSSPARAAMKAR